MPAATPNGLQSASRGYFGILGEVTCPGVYELPHDCTFGQLLRRAGGVTRDATGNTRVFRGGRVAQQLFVASSDAVALSPGDLIVIERTGTRQPASRPPAVAPAPHAAEVQIGFLNLIDRPVVVRMPGELASPARIVELLRQSPELVEGVRVVGPSRRDAGRAPDSSSEAGLLPSGTVLIFPAHRIRVASLPSLPDPIAPPGKQPDLSSGAESPTTSTKSPQRIEAPPVSRVDVSANCRAESTGLAPAGPPPQEQIERLIHAGEAAARSRFRNVAPREWERAQRQAAEHLHTRPYFSFFVLAGTAVLAMLLTVGSMVRRWINVAQWQQRNPTACVLPPAPTLFAPEGANRPIRVDANLPRTRLGIDLAVFERARARHAQGLAAQPDPAPKAA
jgi:hypothetical protein